MRVHRSWIRQPRDNDSTTIVVCKVEAFADLAAAHSKENGAFEAGVIDFVVELVHGRQKFVFVTRLDNGRLNLLNALPYWCPSARQLRPFPRLMRVEKGGSGKKKHENNRVTRWEAVALSAIILTSIQVRRTV